MIVPSSPFTFRIWNVMSSVSFVITIPNIESSYKSSLFVLLAAVLDHLDQHFTHWSVSVICLDEVLRPVSWSLPAQLSPVIGRELTSIFHVQARGTLISKLII